MYWSKSFITLFLATLLLCLSCSKTKLQDGPLDLGNGDSFVGGDRWRTELNTIIPGIKRTLVYLNELGADYAKHCQCDSDSLACHHLNAQLKENEDGRKTCQAFAAQVIPTLVQSLTEMTVADVEFVNARPLAESGEEPVRAIRAQAKSNTVPVSAATKPGERIKIYADDFDDFSIFAGFVLHERIHQTEFNGGYFDGLGKVKGFDYPRGFDDLITNFSFYVVDKGIELGELRPVTEGTIAQPNTATDPSVTCRVTPKERKPTVSIDPGGNLLQSVDGDFEIEMNPGHVNFFIKYAVAARGNFETTLKSGRQLSGNFDLGGENQLSVFVQDQTNNQLIRCEEFAVEVEQIGPNTTPVYLNVRHDPGVFMDFLYTTAELEGQQAQYKPHGNVFSLFPTPNPSCQVALWRKKFSATGHHRLAANGSGPGESQFVVGYCCENPLPGAQRPLYQGESNGSWYSTADPNLYQSMVDGGWTHLSIQCYLPN